MKLERITVRNFRNIEESTLTADPHLNFLVGANGHGKTSFIEAIGYLATLRSFRNAKSEEVVRLGQETAEIAAVVTPELHKASDWRTDLKVSFHLPERSKDPTVRVKSRASKVAFINGKPFKSSTQYLSQRFGNVELGFHAVVFNPSDHDLIRGEPALRRSFIDRVLAAENVEYIQLLHKYQRVLDQRNALLKNDILPSPALLAGFSEPLVKNGSLIAFNRLQWIFRLRERLIEVASHIAPNQPIMRLIYLSNWVPEIQGLSSSNKSLGSSHFAGLPHPPSLEILEQAFWKQLSLMSDAEIRSRSSLVGPHRDDWTFFLGDQVLKGHGSQGEVRTALLSMKLCEIELFKNQTGHRPLLLLDDFSSELDRERRSFLLGFLRDTDLQVFVTTTEDSIGFGQRFWVSNGKLSASESKKDVNDDSTP